MSDDRDLLARAFACVEALRKVAARMAYDYVEVGDDYDDWAQACISSYEAEVEAANWRAEEKARWEHWGRDCLNVAERLASIAAGDHAAGSAHHQLALADLSGLKEGPRRGRS